MTLESKLNKRNARVAVIGLGYVGLPQAMAMAEAGFRVTGIDVSAERVAMLRDGVDRHAWIDAADQALYTAKREGRQCVRIAPAPSSHAS